MARSAKNVALLVLLASAATLAAATPGSSSAGKGAKHDTKAAKHGKNVPAVVGGPKGRIDSITCVEDAANNVATIYYFQQPSGNATVLCGGADNFVPSCEITQGITCTTLTLGTDDAIVAVESCEGKEGASIVFLTGTGTSFECGQNLTSYNKAPKCTTFKGSDASGSGGHGGGGKPGHDDDDDVVAVVGRSRRARAGSSSRAGVRSSGNTTTKLTALEAIDAKCGKKGAGVDSLVNPVFNPDFEPKYVYFFTIEFQLPAGTGCPDLTPDLEEAYNAYIAETFGAIGGTYEPVFAFCIPPDFPLGSPRLNFVGVLSGPANAHYLSALTGLQNSDLCLTTDTASCAALPGGPIAAYLGLDEFEPPAESPLLFFLLSFVGADNTTCVPLSELTTSLDVADAVGTGLLFEEPPSGTSSIDLFPNTYRCDDEGVPLDEAVATIVGTAFPLVGVSRQELIDALAAAGVFPGPADLCEEPDVGELCDAAGLSKVIVEFDPSGGRRPARARQHTRALGRRGGAAGAVGGKQQQQRSAQLSGDRAALAEHIAATMRITMPLGGPRVSKQVVNKAKLAYVTRALRV